MSEGGGGRKERHERKGAKRAGLVLGYRAGLRVPGKGLHFPDILFLKPSPSFLARSATARTLRVGDAGEVAAARCAMEMIPIDTSPFTCYWTR